MKSPIFFQSIKTYSRSACELVLIFQGCAHLTGALEDGYRHHSHNAEDAKGYDYFKEGEAATMEGMHYCVSSSLSVTTPLGLIT